MKYYLYELPIGIQQTIYNYLNNDSKIKLLKTDFNIIYHSFQTETIELLSNTYKKLHTHYFIDSDDLHDILRYHDDYTQCDKCRFLFNYNDELKVCDSCSIFMCDCTNGGVYYKKYNTWICEECNNKSCEKCEIKINYDDITRSSCHTCLNYYYICDSCNETSKNICKKCFNNIRPKCSKCQIKINYGDDNTKISCDKRSEIDNTYMCDTCAYNCYYCEIKINFEDQEQWNECTKCELNYLYCNNCNINKCNNCNLFTCDNCISICKTCNKQCHYQTLKLKCTKCKLNYPECDVSKCKYCNAFICQQCPIKCKSCDQSFCCQTSILKCMHCELKYNICTNCDNDDICCIYCQKIDN